MVVKGEKQNHKREGRVLLDFYNVFLNSKMDELF